MLNDDSMNERRDFPLWTGAVILEVEVKFTGVATNLSHGCTANILRAAIERGAQGSELRGPLLRIQSRFHAASQPAEAKG